jgi:death on curing protein
VVFLELNGCKFHADEVDATLRTLALAAGEMKETAYAEWLKANSNRA